MTAAYDDDTLTSRRQENLNNSDVPVDLNTQNITVINLTEKSTSEENGAMSENCQELDQNKTKELLYSESSTVQESKTVNCTIQTGRSSIDVGNAVANIENGNCTSTVQGNPSETCFMLSKQKNVEEIVRANTNEETYSYIDRNSIVNSDSSGSEIGSDNSQDYINDVSPLYSGLQITDSSSELELSSSTLKINIREEKDLNCNLTDENKSKEFMKISQELLIDNETLPVNFNYPQQNNGAIKTSCQSSAVTQECSSESSKNSIESYSRFTNLKSPQNTRRSKTSLIEMFEGRKSEDSECSNEESFDDYDPESEISFHEAIRAGDAKSVEMLMEHGVVQNIDEPDWNVSGDPPLLVAATNHSLPVLRTLLTNGCDPGVRSPRGETALHRAIINGSPSSVYEMVEELLRHDCPSTVKEAGGGLTALHILTRQLANAQSSKSLHHNFDIALKTLDLLAKVGPVNAKDHQGRSALHLLASSSTFGNSHRVEIEPMIKTLLDAGADPALKNDRGETPLHEALERGALNTAFFLIPHTPVGITSRYGETPLHIAARKNQSEVVDSLLKRGEDPSFQDAGGNTPLHLASARGFHQTVSLLVTSPLAQLEKANDDGLTSLQVAAESGFVNAVRLLLKAGADPSQTAHYCVTTLHRHPDISILINHELTRRRQLAA